MTTPPTDSKMSAERQKMRDALLKAENYLREIVPHDAPSSARKVEILGFFFKLRGYLAHPMPDVVTVDMFLNNVGDIETDEDSWPEELALLIQKMYPHGLIIKGDAP